MEIPISVLRALIHPKPTSAKILDEVAGMAIQLFPSALLTHVFLDASAFKSVLDICLVVLSHLGYGRSGQA